MIKLPSGAELVVTDTPFKVSKRLYEVFIQETKTNEVSSKGDLLGIFRAIFLSAMSSDKIQIALWDCMKFAKYNGLKIDNDTFENMSAREDYPSVCLEVAYSNLYPFLKNLSAQYALLLEKLQGNLA